MIWPFSTINKLKAALAMANETNVQAVKNFEDLHTTSRLQGELIDKMADELEIERMRLVACGVGAMANTRSSAAQQRVKEDSPYFCASVGDVYRMVDREMQLREDIQEEIDHAFRATESHVKTMRKFQEALDLLTEIVKGPADLVKTVKFIELHRSTKNCTKCGSEMIPMHSEDKKLCSNGACGHEVEWKLEDGQQYQYKRNVEPFVEDRSQSSQPPATNQQRL